MAKSNVMVVALLCSYIAVTTAQTPDNQCFWKNSAGIVSESTQGWHVCNNTKTTATGASLCCLNGAQCGEDSICHFPGGSQGGTGWFLGGCTDGSYNDPICAKACTDFGTTWIQYNNSEQLWHCCGNDDCGQPNTPSNETFQAVAQTAWSALPSTATSTASTATATGTNGASQTSNASSNNDSDNSSSGLSTGAQAGIGVGVAVGAIVVITAFAFWFLRRRKNSGGAESSAEVQGMMSHKDDEDYQYQGVAAPAYPGKPQPRNNKDPIEMSQEQRVELGSGPSAPQELGATQDPSELPGDERR
ncbi:Hypothetical predicted protein [Lecanosticta acicola]|uniref:Mid2 domain-containing protein n=1 Tax=Lecanosticta acicola TaxID=111012 RepID=A0AAI8Z328_9PEZI|nr:Hypothetical predicted protein [Lecanosticta acicola]